MSEKKYSLLLLTENDPLKRLDELRRQGYYNYNIRWTKFSNGLMMECKIYRNHRNVLIKEAQFVPSPKNIQEAKRVIAAIILDRLGLGVTEEYVDLDSSLDENGVELDSSLEEDQFSTQSMNGSALMGDMFKVLTKTMTQIPPERKREGVDDASGNYKEDVFKRGMELTTKVMSCVGKNISGTEGTVEETREIFDDILKLSDNLCKNPNETNLS